MCVFGGMEPILERTSLQPIEFVNGIGILQMSSDVVVE